MITNPAFEFLRKHKQVSEETETLVMKKVRGRVTQDELFTVFENGITGQYGKIYSLDPQTLMTWVETYSKGKNSSKNYLSTGLEPVTTPTWENIEWDKEANKCFTAFLNGVSETYFHPAVYDRMMLDGKIKINAYIKYFTETGNHPYDVQTAKQKILRDTFWGYKSTGWTFVYFIK